MCDTKTLAAFIVAGVAIILAPGPAQALVLARTLEKGRAVGILTALGLNSAVFVHALAAGLGVSAVLATSALAFGVVKLVGAGYLGYLGLRALWASGGTAKTERPPPTGRDRVLLQAFITGVLNPKVALFFLAFLPQFVCPARGSVLLQFLVLGTLLAAMDVVYETGLVLLASTATSWLASPRIARWRARVTGAVLIGLGLKLAFASRR